MRATIALLTVRNPENAVSSVAWQIHRHWHTSVGARRLAPHVSLKQLFEIGDDLPALEQYMAEFAASVPPTPVHLSGLCVWQTVLFVAVEDTLALHTLHNRLNRELPVLFGDVRALHDGGEYRFRMTVGVDGARAETYQAIYAEHAAQPFATTR